MHKLFHLPCTFLILTAIALLGGSARSHAVEKRIDTILLPHDPAPGGVIGWAAGSILNLDGKRHLVMLVTANYGGHDDSPAKIFRFDSLDGGLSWTPLEKAAVFQDMVGLARQTVTGPSLLRLRNGDILFFFTVGNSDTDGGTWMRRSTDDGKTWSDPKQLPYEGYGEVCNDRAMQLSTGRILLPAWVSMDRLASSHAYCFFSDDDGHTWKKTALISTPRGSTGRKTDPAAEEPMVVELKDGRLMMVLRAYLKSIFVSYSDDQGATWSPPRASGIPAPGSMTTITRMPDGNILLLWNWAPPEVINGPFPRNCLKAAVSTDEGKNFTFVRHLDGGPEFQGKITMANVVFCDGNAVITYSKSESMKNAYNWRLQVIPLAWFYEGDQRQVYGVDPRETPQRPVGAATVPPAKDLARPDPAERAAALKALSQTSEMPAEAGRLVAAYNFDEPGGPFVFDLSGNGNDLTAVQVGECPKRQRGRKGNAVLFDGNDGLLMAPDSKSLAFAGGAFTVEVWVCPTESKHYSGIVSKEHVFQVALVGGRLKAAVRSAEDDWGTTGWLGNTPVPLEQWSKIGVCYDGQAISFLLNENLVEQVPRRCCMAANDEPLTVGRITHIDGSSFAGAIDELRVWNAVTRDVAAALKERSGDSTPPRKIGATHELLIDESLLAQTDGLGLVVNQPVKHHENPVLTYTKPWEGNCVIMWGSVLFDEDQKRFLAWYEVYKKFPLPGEAPMLFCYATSKDGIHWEKPELGLIKVSGSKANNVVMAGEFDAPTVVRHPNQGGEKRYLMVWYDCKAEGIRVSRSPDGIHWTHPDALAIASGDRSTAGYDPLRGKFYVITRVRDRKHRTCGLWESQDGERFQYIKEIAAADDQDPAETEFYGMVRFPCAGTHLGVIEMFYIPERKLNAQLAYSRDGLQWHRAAGRQTFLDWGPQSSWDRAWVFPSHNPPIRVGDRLYVFYQGRQTLHWAAAPFGHIGSVGLAFLRPEGFVSLEPIEPVDRQNTSHGYQGTATTILLLLEGGTLHVNAIARPGTIHVEVLDDRGVPIPGFTREDCQPIHMVDSLDTEVSWSGNRTLRELAGKPVRLRFQLQAAKLYSFWTQ